jgi:hypothetical protein
VSRENVAVVRDLVDVWDSGVRDFARFSDWFDAAVEVEGPLSSVSGEPYHGRAGIERWARDVDQQFVQWTFSPDEIREVGETVIATGTLTARGRESGIALESPVVMIYEFSGDHRVTRWRVYLDVQEGLKAVGLEE